MVNLEELEKLFEEDYRVLILYPLVNRKPKDIMGFISFFKIKLSPRDVLHPSNSDKTIAVLRKTTGNQVEVFTSDEAILNRINKRLEYQKEPIGMIILARCLATGGRSDYGGSPHLDQLIESLDGLWGWEFKLKDDVGSFNVVIRLDETNREYGEAVREQLQLLFDYLAIIRNVGFYIKQFSCQLRPRMELNAFPGHVEEMLRPVTSEEINNIKAILSSDKDMLAARGLNQSYIENCMPSRLSMLWAATEQVFSSKPQRLLTKDEVSQILELIGGVESLKNDPDRLKVLKNAISDPNQLILEEKEADQVLELISGVETLRNDPNRLKVLKNAISNPNRLPLKGRNRRMAEEIAPIMNIDVEIAERNLSRASNLRGKNVHQLSDDWEDLKEAEKFLQEALLSYLKR